ncbi:MAG: serine/threonine-protein phosphatase [Firmicutes bacterium]|nr:serine/threonine-protein phosphatase [Bacillota bacterium]
MEVSIGYASLAAEAESCGDTAVSCCLPGGGRAVILSDGMGRGSSAAAESQAVVRLLRRLLKSGMTAGQAIQTVNLHMEQEKNEIFATLDLVILDLECGTAVFYKQAAAPSFVVRGGRLMRIQQPALPVGIVPAVKLARVTLALAPGDTIILMSDGISDSGRRSWVGRYLTSLIYDEIESGRQYGPRQLADRILTEAVRQGKGRTADDATVAVMRLR